MFAQISFTSLLALPLLATAGLIPSGVIPSGIIPTLLTGIIPSGVIPSGGGEGVACATSSVQCCGSTQRVSLSSRRSLIRKLTRITSPPT